MLDWNEVEAQFALLPLREQMIRLERLQRAIRENAYPEIDEEEQDRLIGEMANDPGIQAELRLDSPRLPLPAKESA